MLQFVTCLRCQYVFFLLHVCKINVNAIVLPWLFMIKWNACRNVVMCNGASFTFNTIALLSSLR